MVLDRKTGAQRELDGAPRSEHVTRHQSQLSLGERCSRLGQRPVTLWLTGLPRAGKSTLAYALEARLFELGFFAHVLDSGTLRLGISRDLGFGAADRGEHVRRAAHLARVTNELGMITVVALVSPFELDRVRARDVIGEERFLEVHVAAPQEVCEARDEQGLYARARSGEIENFSGVSAPYEAPEAPDLLLATDRLEISESVAALVDLLRSRGCLGAESG